MKIIFLDADGTLFHPKGYIPESAKIAIQKAQNNGHKIILCTGRQQPEIYGELEAIPYDGKILGAGAIIQVGDTILEEHSFSNKQLARLTHYISSHNMPVIFEGNNGLYTNAQGLKKIKSIYKDYTKDLSEEEKENNGVTRIQRIVTPVGYEDMHSLKVNKASFLESHIPYQKVYDDLKDEFEIIRATFAPFGNESGEIAHKHISKATGMKALIDYFNIDSKDVMSIGDGENDFPMFEQSHISIAMGNAVEPLKKMADYITTDLDNDGIYNAFKHYHLI